MKKLLYTTTAFVLCGGIVQANAACIATPSCTAMGYTSTSSCTNGIKCPFGNYWNCDLANKITELTNKITEIEQKVEDLETPKEVCYIGSILYSDKSCSVTVIAGKTPIGIVVYIDGTGGGQALALKSIGSYEWGGYLTDISGLTNYNSESAASKDYDSCGNTAKIIAAGDKSTYPAAWAAHEYSTEGTSAGDWCLPAAGIFTSVYNNQTAPTLGRRPSSITASRGTRTLAIATVWTATATAVRMPATRSAPSSLFRYATYETCTYNGKTYYKATSCDLSIWGNRLDDSRGYCYVNGGDNLPCGM